MLEICVQLIITITITRVNFSFPKQEIILIQERTIIYLRFLNLRFSEARVSPNTKTSGTLVDSY